MRGFDELRLDHRCGTPGALPHRARPGDVIDIPEVAASVTAPGSQPGGARRLRRMGRWLHAVAQTGASESDRLAYADLTLDRMTREVRRSARSIQLTPIEFDLLELFLENPRRVLTRAEISTRVWGFDFGVMSNSLTVYVGYLRRKTESAGEARLIHTVRGIGYVLRTEGAS